jgi:PAS domain-containing protein
MRDEHRPKHELIHELTGLRKQVGDLRDAMVSRRRVEDALRTSESVLRSLTDGAPVGLALFRSDGTLLAANRPLARMLGYETSAELLAIAGVLGVFASAEDRALAFGPAALSEHPHAVRFRLKSGCGKPHGVLAAECPDSRAIALAVFANRSAEGDISFPAPSA